MAAEWRKRNWPNGFSVKKSSRKLITIYWAEQQWNWSQIGFVSLHSIEVMSFWGRTKQLIVHQSAPCVTRSSDAVLDFVCFFFVGIRRGCGLRSDLMYDSATTDRGLALTNQVMVVSVHVQSHHDTGRGNSLIPIICMRAFVYKSWVSCNIHGC